MDSVLVFCLFLPSVFWLLCVWGGAVGLERRGGERERLLDIFQGFGGSSILLLFINLFSQESLTSVSSGLGYSLVAIIIL